MRIPQIMTLILILLVASSCSGSKSVTMPSGVADPGEMQGVFSSNSGVDFSPESMGWYPQFAGQLIPESDGEFSMIEDRESLQNINATNLILNAHAFRYNIVSVTGNLFELDLTITNPTSLMAYDVRIIFNNIGNNVVKNPDSYTKLFSTDKSPYISFAKTDPNRMFPIGPGVTDTQKLFLELNGGPVGFVIAISMPGQCEEPYEITHMNVIGDLREGNIGWASLSCLVADHQWDMQYVVADLTLFTGRMEYMVSDPTEPNKFEVYFRNTQGVMHGTYPTWVAAKSKGSELLCYNMIEIVVGGGPEPPIVTITTPDIDPFYTNERFTTIAGTIDNFTGTEAILEVNGDQQTIAVNGNTFSDTAILLQQDNFIKVIASGPGGIGEDTVTVVSTAATADLWVRLTWDQDDTDVDMYVTEPGPSHFTCWYSDQVSPDTGAELDVDDIDGFGPEHYFLSVAQGHTLYPGTYEIDVQYYSDHSTGSTPLATILIYKGNNYYGEWSHLMDYSDSSEAGPENRRLGLLSWWDNVANVEL